MKNVKIGNNIIGNTKPTYIIAEIGGNFSSFEQGKKLIDNAITSGANSVKLQTYKAENYVSTYATFDMPGVGGKKNQLDVIKQLELDFDIQKQLYEYCTKRKITIFSTPSHISDVEFLEEIGNAIYKIGSDDLTNLPFIKKISKLNKPTIISTGMSTITDVRNAVNSFHSTGNKKLILLHCVSMYPVEPKYANLSAIETMKDEFNVPVGWSDHTVGINTCVTAATLGANVIEKHFTLNKKAKGPDHVISADLKDLKLLVNSIRQMEIIKGNGKKIPAACEIGNIKDIRKSVVASQTIDKGEKITKEMLTIKRPGIGIPPKNINKIIGKYCIKKINYDEPIKWKFLYNKK